jgi:hypothetical protein
MADARPPKPTAAFVSDFVDVEAPMAAVEERFCGAVEWLLPLADTATDDGEALLVRIGPSTGLLSRVVRVRLGGCAARRGGAVIPIRWESASQASLFPVLDGTLVLNALDDAHCRLTLEASYRPPLDRVGLWLDSVIFHRVAQSTVRSFLQRVGRSFEGSLAQSDPPDAPPATSPGAPPDV